MIKAKDMREIAEKAVIEEVQDRIRRSAMIGKVAVSFTIDRALVDTVTCELKGTGFALSVAKSQVSETAECTVEWA